MIADDMHELYQQLVRTAEADKPRIAEERFVRSLLPYLVNYYDEPDRDMTVWLDIAGNPHREIDVVDRNGELLFTVPPLLARTPSILPEKERLDLPLGEVLAIYAAKQDSDHPAAADAYLEHSLRHQVFSPEQLQLLGYLKQWVTIYTRYGIDTTRLLGEYTVKPEVTKPERAPGDDLEGELLDF